MAMKATTLTGLLALAMLVLAGACAGDGGDGDGQGGGGGGGEPNAAVVDVLNSLPVFPNAEGASLVNGRYTYSPGASETGRDLWTGFDVAPGTTPEAVTSFFSKELPAQGWQEEGPPWTEQGEKHGTVWKTVIYTFVKGDLRLHIQIPMNPPKDETPPPGGVTRVSLILVPTDVQLYGSPAATGIDSTPPATRKQSTPANTAPPVPSYEPTPVTPTP